MIKNGSNVRENKLSKIWANTYKTKNSAQLSQVQFFI